MKTVVYHSADYDGIFCREIAKKFLGEKDVDYIGWNFGDPKIPMPPNGEVYILDLSPECLDVPDVELDDASRVVWIDHHKTSIEKWSENLKGYRIDGVAACRLAWQYFTCEDAQLDGAGRMPYHFKDWPMPTKQDFIDRKVSEPLAVRLAGEYDIWDKRDPDADTFQYALRCVDLDTAMWADLLTPAGIGKDQTVGFLLRQGQTAQQYACNVDASICKSLTWIMEWEGLKFLCVNHARFNSLLFAAKDKPETGHDALLGFRFDGKTWMVSLYHAAHRKDLDLSVIAQKYGGGGHKGACGFTCDKLPFMT